MCVTGCWDDSLSESRHAGGRFLFPTHDVSILRVLFDWYLLEVLQSVCDVSIHGLRTDDGIKAVIAQFKGRAEVRFTRFPHLIQFQLSFTSRLRAKQFLKALGRINWIFSFLKPEYTFWVCLNSHRLRHHKQTHSYCFSLLHTHTYIHKFKNFLSIVTVITKLSYFINE